MKKRASAAAKEKKFERKAGGQIAGGHSVGTASCFRISLLLFATLCILLQLLFSFASTRELLRVSMTSAIELIRSFLTITSVSNEDKETTDGISNTLKIRPLDEVLNLKLEAEKQTIENVVWNQSESATVTGQHLRSRVVSKNDVRSKVETSTSKNPKVHKEPSSTYLGGSVSWDNFLKLPIAEKAEQLLSMGNEANKLEVAVNEAVPRHLQCPASIDIRLNGPSLRREDVDWCRWALDASGGGIVVGKSWGKLVKDARARVRYETLQCDLVARGNKVPSCSEGWGDERIKNWVNTSIIASAQCSTTDKSPIQCYGLEGLEKFCVLTKSQINFKLSQDTPKAGTDESGKGFARKITRGFISADCDASDNEQGEKYFPFRDIYSPTLISESCDVVINKTVLMFSHDHIDNLAHTMQDMMNVWSLAWLAGQSRLLSNTVFLNIDTLNQYGNGKNHLDKPNALFETYRRAFESLIPGSSFAGKTVCIDRLLVQPVPVMRYVWENWEKDAPCSFVGPSSLFQRFNLHVRHSYGLLAPPGTGAIDRMKELDSSASSANSANGANSANTIQVLFIVRSETSNTWGSIRSARIIKNTKRVEQELTTLFAEKSKALGRPIQLVLQDLAALSYSEQIALVSRSSIMVGVHGAGIASMMHMPIGREHCCGLLEVFPLGEFTPARGYGNMARRLGLHYSRIDVSPDGSRKDGVFVPVEELIEVIAKMIDGIVKTPTCVLSSVVNDPYFDKWRQ